MTGGEIKLLVRRQNCLKMVGGDRLQGTTVSRWEWKPRRESRELI